MDPSTLLALIPGMPPGASSIGSQNVANWNCGSTGFFVIFGLILALWFAARMERWYTYMTGRDRKGRRVGRHRNGE